MGGICALRRIVPYFAAQLLCRTASVRHWPFSAACSSVAAQRRVAARRLHAAARCGRAAARQRLLLAVCSVLPHVHHVAPRCPSSPSAPHLCFAVYARILIIFWRYILVFHLLLNGLETSGFFDHP